MFEGYYAEHVIRERDRERARALAMPRLPASVQGAAWGLRKILDLMIR